MSLKSKPKPKPKAAAKKPRRNYDSASPLSIAKSIAARFGEEINEDEFFDEPELEVKTSSIPAIP